MRYQIFFKKRCEPRVYSVALHPNGPVLAWGSTWLVEAAGDSLGGLDARAKAESAVKDGLDLAAWRSQGVQSTDPPQRRRFLFTFDTGMGG